jgi:hypothetical protein
MQRASGLVTVVGIALLVLLPMLYVLAIGPLVWFADNGMISDGPMEVIAVIYWPLEKLAEKSPLVETPLMAYVDWWRSPPPPSYPTPYSPPPAASPPPQPSPALQSVPTPAGSSE